MKPRSAFSLVEVVLALAVFSFAIISLFGLMSVGLQNGRESAVDLSLGLMAQTVSSTLRMQGYSNVLSNVGYASNNANPDFYFNADGELALDAAGLPVTAAPADTTYACALTRCTPATLTASNVIFLRMSFSWPWQAPETNRQTRTVLMSLANYE